MSQCPLLRESAHVVHRWSRGDYPDLVTRHKASKNQYTYLERVQYACAPCQAGSALYYSAKPSSNPSRVVPGHIIQSSYYPALHAHNEDRLTGEGVNLLQKGAENPYTGSSLVLYASDVEDLMALQNRRYHLIHASSVAQKRPQMYSNHQGWFERPSSWIEEPAAKPMRTGVKIICHECYDPNPISLECVLSFRDQGKVLDNDERITPTENILVPSASYQRFRMALGMERPEEVKSP